MILVDELRSMWQTIFQPEPKIEVDTSPRYGGINGGPLMSDDMPTIERLIREDFDHFDAVYLDGNDNWLMRQRTGRLCEDIVRHVLREIEAR